MLILGRLQLGRALSSKFWRAEIKKVWGVFYALTDKTQTHPTHYKKYGGSDLLSHTPPSAVPSAQTTLATGF
ncbi:MULTISPECIES: hypothetical protein, partial [Actinotignum]|uniref:hypothetical protein n=2 Tax=Actinomycetaceae TaxID=2049 RepID=UPI00254D09D1